MKKKILYTILILVGLSLSSKNILAQENQNNQTGFSMSPFFKEITLEKDQNDASFSLEIANNTEKSATLRLSVLDFGALDESGGVAFLGSSDDLKNKYALASWVKIEKDVITLNSGEKQNVKVTIENKESLSPGGHYGAIMAKMENVDDGTGSESSIVALDPSFASLIFVRKIGGEVFGLDLKDQVIEKQVLGLPSSVKLRFQNTGNVHVAPRGVITLTDPIGREISQGIINEQSGIILPQTFRKFPTELKMLNHAFMPGKYILTVKYRYDGKDDFVMQQENLYFFPTGIAAALIILLALAFLSWKRFAKKILKKKLKKADDTAKKQN